MISRRWPEPRGRISQIKDRSEVRWGWSWGGQLEEQCSHRKEHHIHRAKKDKFKDTRELQCDYTEFTTREGGPEMMQETQQGTDCAGPSWLCWRDLYHPKTKGKPWIVNRGMTWLVLSFAKTTRAAVRIDWGMQKSKGAWSGEQPYPLSDKSHQPSQHTGAFGSPPPPHQTTCEAL